MARAESPALPESRWVRSPDTLWRCANGTLVILPPNAGDPTPLAVSGSAALVWELLATPTTLSDLASVLSELCDTDADTITRDLEPLLDQLNSAAVVRRVP
jgi:hypothetical protein